MDARSSPDVFLFDRFRLDRRGGGLFRRADGGKPLPVGLGSRALDVLCVLVAQHGDLVSKDAIMAAVWPNTTVEEANLTVQISTLRRILDQGRDGESCIQTVPGRGYRFVPRVTREEERPPDSGFVPVGVSPEPLATSRWRRPRWRWPAAASGGIALAVLLVALAWHGGWFSWRSPPRFSIVVLPFDSLSDHPDDDYLADGITDDLTSDLSHIPGSFVIARQSAYTYKGKARNVRTIGGELGVRYVLEGSVRRMASAVRVNVQLTSAETGAELWSDRFDEPVGDLSAGQDQIVTRMGAELGISLFEIEKARSLRERPTNPDAFDLILQGRALYNQPPSLERHLQAQALFERALSLDPSSVSALSWVVLCLIERSETSDRWKSLETAERIERLMAQARALAPESGEVLGATFQWLRMQGRCREAIPVAEQLIQRLPNYALGYAYLGSCKILVGSAEEDLPLEEKAMQLNPRDPNLFLRYRRMGFASLLLGRDQAAITFLRQSLAIQGDYENTKHSVVRQLAAAYARAGQMEEAKRSLAEADRLWPYITVRTLAPDDPSSPVLADQIRGFQAALRLAGERDHADEDADFGVAADAALHSVLAGRTPKDAPGVTTVCTADVARLIVESRPIVIDTVMYSWGRSIPGAVGLKNAGFAGSLTDEAQDHLRRQMQTLTAGDLGRPIVAAGWNSERFDGRNLALRLAALGYTRVYWYRGGREAWEANGLPETELDLQDW